MSKNKNLFAILVLNFKGGVDKKCLQLFKGWFKYEQCYASMQNFIYRKLNENMYVFIFLIFIRSFTEMSQCDL